MQKKVLDRNFSISEKRDPSKGFPQKDLRKKSSKIIILLWLETMDD
jgi:hypothetical protein